MRLIHINFAEEFTHIPQHHLSSDLSINQRVRRSFSELGRVLSSNQVWPNQQKVYYASLAAYLRFYIVWNWDNSNVGIAEGDAKFYLLSHLSQTSQSHLYTLLQQSIHSVMSLVVINNI